MVSPSPSSSLVHRVLVALFPEMATWSSSARRGMLAGHHRPLGPPLRRRQPPPLTTPLEVRDALARELPEEALSIPGFFDPVTHVAPLGAVELLVAVDRDDDADVAVFDTVAASAMFHDDASHYGVTDELLRALRVVLTAFAIADGNSRLPIKVRVSERHWHCTLYWLNNVLSLMCSKVCVRFDSSWSVIQRRSRGFLTDGEDIDDERQEIAVRACAIRWRSIALRDSCIYCTIIQFQRYLTRVSDSVGTRSSVVRISAYAQFVRSYGRALARCAVERCWFHHCSNEDQLYRAYLAEWSNFRVHLRYAKSLYRCDRSNRFDRRDAMDRVAKVAYALCYMLTRSPDPNWKPFNFTSTLRFNLAELFDIVHWLPTVFAMFDCDWSRRVTVRYDESYGGVGTMPLCENRPLYQHAILDH